MVLPERTNLVPPQPVMCGQDAGKSTVRLPLGSPSVAPLSPEAAKMLIPSEAASCAAESNAFMACWVHEFSGPPQLMEITLGFRFVS